MICEVLRPFTARGTHYDRGQQVDTSIWPLINVDAMLSQHWIAAVDPRVLVDPRFAAESAPPAPPKRGPGRPPKVQPEEGSDGA